MGIPPVNVYTYGRANPQGINYLYTADDISTVLSEVRAWKEAVVSVVEIIVQKDLRIVDLTDIYEIGSPFDMPFDNLSNDIQAIEILKAFQKELSKPVNPNYSDIDYIPTQYISELIKANRYDGIKFHSSVGKGNNVVLFEQKNVKFKDVKLYQVKDIEYYFEEYKV